MAIPENALELGLSIPTYEEIMRRNAEAEQAKAQAQSGQNLTGIVRDLETIERITGNDSEHYGNKASEHSRNLGYQVDVNDRF